MSGREGALFTINSAWLQCESYMYVMCYGTLTYDSLDTCFYTSVVVGLIANPLFALYGLSKAGL